LKSRAAADGGIPRTKGRKATGGLEGKGVWDAVNEVGREEKSRKETSV